MIKLVNLTKIYYSAKGATIGLRDINLTLPDTGLVAITGESGSGKSTLLNVISGLDSYEEGEMYFDDIDTSIFDKDDYEEYRKKNIAFVYQNYNLVESYTALDNVISSMLINGQSYKEAKEKAIQILDRVGLKDFINNKSTNLSSGQRQRLSIARALAKDTKVIVCDEPTGNLDSETGRQIVEILHDISKTKLVIVATHNYPDFENSTDLFIRLYRGEIVTTDIINNTFDKKVSELENKQDKTYMHFVRLNYKSQPKRIIFNILFMTICSLIMFIMLAYFTSNLDKSSTLVLSNSVFANCEKERIVLKSDDGFSDEDLNEVLNLKHVVSIDKFDLANEVNYYYRLDEDYSFSYSITNNVEKSGNSKASGTSINFLDDTNYLRSYQCLTKDDLSSGKLPEYSNEVVLYNSKYELNDEIVFYFKSFNVLGQSNYYATKMKVVGILKDKKDDQVYFSDHMMESFVYNYLYYSSISSYGYLPNRSQILKRDIKGRMICNDTLDSETIRLNKSNYNTAYASFSQWESANVNFTSTKGLKNISKIECSDINYANYIVEVSADIFDYYFEEVEMNQISVYIDDYAYSNDVMEKLSDLGYSCVSPYQSGSATYDSDKVIERLITLYLSFFVLLAISILQITIVYVLSKLKKNDYIILKSIGLKNKEAYYINLAEMLINQVIAYVLSIALFYLLYLCKFKYIFEIIKYVRFYHFIVAFVFELFVSFITSLFYRKYLSKKVKILSLMED